MNRPSSGGSVYGEIRLGVDIGDPVCPNSLTWKSDVYISRYWETGSDPSGCGERADRESVGRDSRRGRCIE
jgi:hypothetical protein